jgi:hypothetical protein
MPATDRDLPAGTTLIRAAGGLPAVLLVTGTVLCTLSGCGGSPMRVEQRYVEPPTPEQKLDQQAEAAKRMQRSHGEGPGAF